ncbi:MAG: hypothetical protein U9N31_06220 [Candidatus Marinimicrobia bacterium]|nr:hypothetical protein [Candidatus Neomarinimicrobiota bacterium]
MYKPTGRSFLILPYQFWIKMMNGVPACTNGSIGRNHFYVDLGLGVNSNDSIIIVAIQKKANILFLQDDE